MINWFANFGMIRLVNRTQPLNVSAAAHTNAVRIESLKGTFDGPLGADDGPPAAALALLQPWRRMRVG